MGKNKFLETKNIYLRSLEEKDLTEKYLQWLNDGEVCKYNAHATFPNNVYKMRAYFDSIKDNDNNLVFSILTATGDNHIGNISLQSINWINRSAEFAILMGEKEFWRKGLSTEAAELIVNYGFERLNLHRIYCGTSSENKGMQHLAHKLRMKEEGCRRQAMFKNGKYVDIIEYGVLRDEFYL